MSIKISAVSTRLAVKKTATAIAFSAMLACALLAAIMSHAAAQADAEAPEASSTLYVYTDDDSTTVITPRLRASAPLNDQTRAELVYMVDVWTSASVDIVASASEAVTEQRDEINATLTHSLAAARVSGAYRFSTEPDYDSHAFTIGGETDFADKSTTVSASGTLSFDQVGRAGEHAFTRSLRMMNLRLGGVQVLDPSTLVHLTYELGHARGYMSSPYRFIGIGSDDGTCRGSDVVYCVPETNPDLRVRHAIALGARRSLGPLFSVGAGYRFYMDSWELGSQTVNLDVAFMPDDLSVLTLRYRLYTQSAAKHYKPKYEEETESQLYTRDKELSPLDSHQIALDAERAFVLDAHGNRLRAVFSLGPVFYKYVDYKLLDSMTAFNATLSLVLEL